jgi:hypothetical protein
LSWAAGAHTTKSKEADERFERAVNVLSAFRDNFPSNDPLADRKWDETVTRAMAVPNTDDRSRGLVDVLKENLYPNVGLFPVAVPLMANSTLAKGK